MTLSPPAASGRREPLAALLICAGIHVLADWLLMRQPWILSDSQLVATLALPIGQCSLCAIWAATGTSSLYLRFAVAVIVTIACWMVLTYCLPWGLADSASAGWAITIGTQTLVIVTAIIAYRRLVGRTDLRAGQHAEQPIPSAFAFDLRTLMLWTTVAAITLGFIQFGRTEWRWSTAVARWDYFRAMPVIGLFNAGLALLWLWAIAIGSIPIRFAKVGAAALLVGIAGSGLPALLKWITGQPAIGDNDGLVLATAQSALLAVSIAGVLFAAARKESWAYAYSSET